MTSTNIFLMANVLLLILVAVVLAVRQRRDSQQIEKNRSDIEFLKNELQALYAGAAGVGTHLAKIDTQLSGLADRQEQLDVHDSATLSYSDAIDLVHQGADEDDLMQRCGLLREEAELLIRLHRDDLVS